MNATDLPSGRGSKQTDDNGRSKTVRTALVSLPDGIWQLIDDELEGTLGANDSEIIRNIVIAHLSEKGYLRPKEQAVNLDNFGAELDMQAAMLNSLVEVLEEKGQLNYNAWQTRIKRKMAEATTSRKSQPKRHTKS